LGGPRVITDLAFPLGRKSRRGRQRYNSDGDAFRSQMADFVAFPDDPIFYNLPV
jgi:hypothetical protein